MGANIIKRRPPVRLPQPADLRPTTQLTERQLDELMFHAHDRFGRAHDDLEAELEFVEDRPEAFPDATPISLPRTSSLRLAHTLLRAPQLEVRYTRHRVLPPRPAPAASRAMAERTDTSIPSSERPTRPEILMPGAPQPAPAPQKAAPSSSEAVQAPPTTGVASDDPPSVLATKRSSSLGVGRACLVFVALFLLTIGAAAYLLQ